MPDVQLTRKAVPRGCHHDAGATDVWVELKVAKGNWVEVRHSQINWMRRRLQTGANNVFLLVKYEDSIVLYKAATVVAAAQTPARRTEKTVILALRPLWNFAWSGVAPINWKLLEEFLFRA